MRKIVQYKNEQGLSMVFGDTAPCYAEKIDATSLSGVFSSDTLARSAGQITTYKTFGARTVVCDFAVVGTDKLDMIIQLFNPSLSGVLTIISESGTYEIECYPTAVPTIQKDSNAYALYRFSVDFVCDYPYFREVGQIVKPLTQGENIIRTRTSAPTPPQIYIPDCSNGATVSTNIATITIVPNNYAIIVDTRLFTAVNAVGADVTSLIDLSSNIEEFRLNYGKNTVILSETSTAELRYYNLVLGVI